MINKQLDTIRRKGYDAFKAGISAQQCPYSDRRTERGSVTFSRAFRLAWFEGWNQASREPTPENTDSIEEL